MQRIGIDIIENKRIKIKQKFIDKVLTIEEKVLLESIISKKAKINFIAGRWAVKEAIFKSLNSKQKISFNKINVGYDNQSPIITNLELSKILISISHEKKYSIGMAINIYD
ncbi:holo-[acyl-carrier-protein] synthase [Entomoplasma ellychniae]|uniref:Holo-[acyl-carrier-protein] synthase n=2 Tax=Entomoplasmataceae TaxID=33925 RepID=A0A2S5RGM7_9MOLU|nr:MULTISPECIES: 4'-phosphopantetheinyl transferase superfamily protein [Entomoplasmataceae]PPE04502.1 holo-[acyl-carrier-protein] synthase [Entomoplasma ellychniae]PPE06275.1 holo-[acyl-carrier-protein] synthase [Mesoplasma corruscae]